MSTRAWIAVGLTLGLTCTTVGSVRAQESRAASDVARAEAFAAQAFDAYSRKDYALAIDLYQNALASAPSADIIYNIARIYDTRLKNRAAAIEWYQRYAKDTGADPDRLRGVSVRLRELRELDAIAATAEAQPPGSAAATGADAAGATSRAGAGALSARGAAASATGTQAPVAHDRSLRPPQPSAAREPALSGMQVVGIMSGAVGLAGLGLGVGFGLKAKSDVDEANRFCDGNICRAQKGVDASHSASDAATISTIAFVAGGALTLLGVTAILLGLDSAPERQEATLTPYATPDGAGALLASKW